MHIDLSVRNKKRQNSNCSHHKTSHLKPEYCSVVEKQSACLTSGSLDSKNAAVPINRLVQKFWSVALTL